jgi:tetratricopeptide (TPR) repeat protein
MSDNLRQGIKLYQSRKYTEALSFFLALPPESSDNIDLAYFIGLCYARLNKYDEALLYLEQVVTNGTDAERIKQCRLSLAVIYSLTNRSKMAEFELSKLVDDGLNTEQVE